MFVQEEGPSNGPLSSADSRATDSSKPPAAAASAIACSGDAPAESAVSKASRAACSSPPG